MKQLRIRAVDDRLHTLLDPTGVVLAGRFAGRDKRRAPLANGELVPDCSHHRRAMLRGDIEILEEVVS